MSLTYIATHPRELPGRMYASSSRIKCQRLTSLPISYSVKGYPPSTQKLWLFQSQSETVRVCQWEYMASSRRSTYAADAFHADNRECAVSIWLSNTVSTWSAWDDIWMATVAVIGMCLRLGRTGSALIPGLLSTPGRHLFLALSSAPMTKLTSPTGGIDVSVGWGQTR